jgi:hypothetical protein
VLAGPPHTPRKAARPAWGAKLDRAQERLAAAQTFGNALGLDCLKKLDTKGWKRLSGNIAGIQSHSANACALKSPGFVAGSVANTNLRLIRRIKGALVCCRNLTLTLTLTLTLALALTPHLHQPLERGVAGAQRDIMTSRDGGD